MSEEKEFKHFCDNPDCPNYDLELNDEKHYHDDHVIVGSICGILKSHLYTIKKQRNKEVSKFIFWKKIIKEDFIKEIYLCDICNSAVQLMLRETYYE